MRELKMIIRFKRYFLSLILISILCGCDKPIKLLDNFYSNKKFEDIKSLLGQDLHVEGSKEKLLIVSIPHYIYSGEEGKLKLLFYENKLAIVGFYPIDIARFNSKIEEEYNIKLEEGKEYLVDENLLVLKSKESRIPFCGNCEETFISWADKRLLEEYKNKVW